MLAFPITAGLSLLFDGVINRTRSVLSGRQGPPLLQVPLDQWRLVNKGSVYSRTTTWVFRLVPIVRLATVILGVLMLPFGPLAGFLSFEADFVFFVYALALGRLLLVWAALDTGSPFEGMGANREALYGLVVEPAIFILFATLLLATGHGNLAEMLGRAHYDGWLGTLLSFVIAFVLFQVMLAETGRGPIDDPRTHLELTMIHEVMILDHSGVDLAMLSYSNSLKLALFGGLIASVLLPPSWPLWIFTIGYMAIVLLSAVLVGVTESVRARNPLRANPFRLTALTSLALLALVAVLILSHRLAI